MSAAYTVPTGAAGERLDVYLSQLTHLSRSAAAKLLREQLVTVNGSLKVASYQVQPADEIIVQTSTPVTRSAALPEIDLVTVYEDNDLLVIDKPAGLSMHSAPTDPDAPTLVDYICSRTTDPDSERPGIVHRLDRDTSGLVIIAKHAAAKEQLQDQFRHRQVKKAYTALVVGHPKTPVATIDLPLDRDPKHPLRRAVVASGRPAVTHYRVLAEYPGYALIEARPQTGRTHQIRVHLASIGHPIAGDTQYGTKARPKGLKRQFLHASALEFVTPSGHQISLTDPLPTDLRTFLGSLEATV